MSVHFGMISVRKLSVLTEQQKVILVDLTFDQSSGTTLGVYGPNGSGKTTLLRAVSGVSQHRTISGEIWVDSKPMSTLSSSKTPSAERVRHVLYVGSDFHSPFSMSVRELLEMGANVNTSDLWPTLDHERRSRISEVVEAMAIMDFLPRELNTLSDGEKQLMMFARCLVQNPKVLVLDETFSKLDLDHLMTVGKMMARWKEKGMTFLVCSHDLNFLSEISDEILFLRKAELIAKGPVAEVFTPHHLSVLYPGIPLQVVVSPESGKYKVLY